MLREVCVACRRWEGEGTVGMSSVVVVVVVGGLPLLPVLAAEEEEEGDWGRVIEARDGVTGVGCRPRTWYQRRIL